MKISEFIKNIQKQPVHIRKIILWSIVIIIGLVFFIWWLKISQGKIKSFNTEEFKQKLNLPPLGEELKGSKEQMPEFQMPEISEEDLKELEEELPKEELLETE